MQSLLGHTLTRVWLLLALLTALAWWLGGRSASAFEADPRWFAAVLMALAFFKVRLVILYFMEIRSAPTPIRLVFEAWVVVACVMIIAIYWGGAAA